MLDKIRNATHYLWENKAATGITTGAVMVASSLTSWGVRNTLIELGASTPVATGVGVVGFIAVTIPYAWTRFSALAEVFNGDAPDENDQFSFDKLSVSQKVAAAAISGIGTLTISLTIGGVDKSYAYMLQTIFNGNPSENLARVFQVAPLTACFVIGVLGYGYNFFLRNTSRLVNWDESFSDHATSVKISVAAGIYLPCALGLGWPLYNFLLQNFPVSVVFAVLAAGANAITYLGQKDDLKLIGEAYRNPHQSRLMFWSKTAALTTSMAFNAMGNYGTLGSTTSIVPLRALGGAVAAVVESGLFNCRMFKQLPGSSRAQEGEGNQLMKYSTPPPAL